MAVGSRESAEQQETQRKAGELRELEEDNAKKSKLIKQLRQSNEDMQRAIHTLKSQLAAQDEQAGQQQEKQAVRTRQLERRVEDLTAANDRLQQERGEQAARVEREVRRLPFNDDILNVIFRALQLHPEA